MTRAGPDGSADGGGGGVGGVHARGLRTRVHLKLGPGDDKVHPGQDVSLCPILGGEEALTHSAMGASDCPPCYLQGQVISLDPLALCKSSESPRSIPGVLTPSRAEGLPDSSAGDIGACQFFLPRGKGLF